MLLLAVWSEAIVVLVNVERADNLLWIRVLLAVAGVFSAILLLAVPLNKPLSKKIRFIERPKGLKESQLCARRSHSQAQYVLVQLALYQAESAFQDSPKRGPGQAGQTRSNGSGELNWVYIFDCQNTRIEFWAYLPGCHNMAFVSHLRVLLLAEFAADVVLRVFVPGIAENLTRLSELNQISGTAALSRIYVKKARIIGDALCLLKVVGDDGYGETLAKLYHQFFDFASGYGIERGTWLVHQEHFRFGRDSTSDAEALLLTAGERQGALVKLVLNLVPKSGGA